MNYAREFGSLIIMLSITGVCILVSVGAMSLIDYIGSLKYSRYYFSIYFLLFVILYFLSNRVKGKILQLLFKIVALPFSILFAIITIGIPFISLFMHIILYVLISTILPLTFFSLQSRNFFPTISLQLATYIALTLTFISSVLFHRQIIYLVHAISPARLKTSEKLRPYNIEELSKYLLSESNIKFVIFSIYLLLLAFINFSNLQNDQYFSSQDVDKAVLQSFATFLAFDRIISNLKQLEFKPSEMLDKIRKGIGNKIDSKP
ncbi:MAG: hypothetical protein ABI576_00550 [Flavobacterium sp.]